MIENFEIKLTQKNIRKIKRIFKIFDKNNQVEVLNKKIYGYDHLNFSENNLYDFISDNDGSVVFIGDKKIFDFITILIQYYFEKNLKPVSIYYYKNSFSTREFIKHFKLNSDLKNVEFIQCFRNRGKKKTNREERIYFFNLPKNFTYISRNYLISNCKSSIFVNFFDQNIVENENNNDRRENKIKYEVFLLSKYKNSGLFNYFLGFCDNLIPVSFVEYIDSKKSDHKFYAALFYLYMRSRAFYNLDEEEFFNSLNFYLNNKEKFNILKHLMGIFDM